MNQPERRQRAEALHGRLSLCAACAKRESAPPCAMCEEEISLIESALFDAYTEGRREQEWQPPVDHRCPEIGLDTLQGAFVAGAKWWEYTSSGGTMWASDRDKAWAEAEKRYPSPPGRDRTSETERE